MNEQLAKLATTALAFFIFFWISKKMFWTSILKAIEDRQARIQGDFDRIDAMQKKVDALQGDYQKRIADIDAEARNRMQEAIAHGRQVAEQIAEQARKEADAALERNKQVIALEMDKAREQLKQDVVQMTLTATERLIRERLDDTRHRQLVTGFVEELSRK